ncbi:Serine/threonine-protein kinase RAD53 [Ceratocystis platani]|uniref:Autophagy-related protein 1 n=1 Tax=Ceratocystis fimbriata f. sp. platani TaxID=88771 RepID=A0A0F8B3I8_CERFI|nr:Serine/threonine-protein kinase RAD53 [Ceratocystis platani]
MDSELSSQLTQPGTQNVLDPRRITGTQTAGLSDDAVSDIICILQPSSHSALAEVQELVNRDSPLAITTLQDMVADPRFTDARSGHTTNFDLMLPPSDSAAIVLELSSPMKNPNLGFVFGRNDARCDVCFTNDPKRRLSNSHFRIYVNEYDVVMLEDISTNGTIVAGDLLKSKGGNPDRVRRMLTPGCHIKILMHEKNLDLVFSVRIPQRDGSAQAQYLKKVKAFRNANIMPPPARNIFGGQNPQNPHNKANAAAPAQKWPLTGVPAAKGSSDLEPWDGAGQYNRMEFIGKGAFALVYKVTDKFNGTPYAAKELDKRRFIKNGVLDEKVENEMKIMRKVRHQNIVQYINHFDWNNRLLIIVMEFVQGGDLGKYVHEVGPLPEAIGQEMSQQMLSALDYLHEKNITHRDVKPDNILISSTAPFTIKLTDFGLSKMVDNDQTFLRTFCGTLLYCAPEVYSEFVEYDLDGRRHPQNRALNRRPGQRYGHAVDIWSLAGVIFYVLTGGPPFPAANGISHTDLLNQIMTRPFDVRPLLIRQISQAGIYFLQSMLQPRPENRATIPQLFSSPWLASPESIAPGPLQHISSFSSDEVSEDEFDLDASGEISRPKMPPPSKIENQSEYEDVEMTGSFLNEIHSANKQNGASPIEQQLLQQEHKPQCHDNANILSEVQSADQVLSLVEGVATQSLNSHDQNNISSNGDDLSVSLFSDFNVSKRKPDFSSSDEFVGHKSKLPPFKKARSDMPLIDLVPSAPVIAIPPDEEEECRLLSCIPSVNRLESGRQIDMPVHKSRFWDKDRATYHLQYPEMTQLQMTAFKQAAADRGEVFEPGQTPLWDLAMKYFPPTDWDQVADNEDPDLTPDGNAHRPSALAPDYVSSGIDSAQPPAVEEAQMLALLESTMDSTISDIHIKVQDSVLTWGRSPENLVQYPTVAETRIPKTAFRLLLWAPNYDASRDRAQNLPWLAERKSLVDEQDYHFYISTKATRGILINNALLQSHNHTSFSSESRYWAQLRNGDELTLWGSGNQASTKVKVVFRCFWGGSMADRADGQAPDLVDTATARKLDETALRTEKRRLDSRFYESREAEANCDYDRRVKYIQRERNRSADFEEKSKNVGANVTALASKEMERKQTL